MLPAHFESDGLTSHKHGLAAKYSLKWRFWKSHSGRFFETNFFRVAGLQAATKSSGKAECLLAIGEHRKVRFFGVISFKKEIAVFSGRL